MSTPYPRIRIHARNGYLLVRDGLILTFYLRRSHHEISKSIGHALDAYVRAVGTAALGLYSDQEGNWQSLDEAGWAAVRDELHKPRSAHVHLTDASTQEQRYDFLYQGRRLDAPFLVKDAVATSAVSFWLPTEFLEQHGPGRVRDLAVEVASLLPFCSGNAGLSFNCDTSLLGVRDAVHELRFRYPGMDVPNMDWDSLHIGTRVRGPSWMTFLGQPVLGELGGASGLRARLHHPESSVHELEGDRAVVTLGPWPEAGDTEQGHNLPAYRELARVLEPCLYQEPQFHVSAPIEDTRRWERRFLD
jgi:hypothetical protein